MLVAHLPIAWIVARAAGMVALALLTFSTWLGLALSTRILGTRRQKPLLGGIARSCGRGSRCSSFTQVPCSSTQCSISGYRRCWCHSRRRGTPEPSLWA